MERKNWIIIAVLLIISVLNFTTIKGNDTIRPIQFLSIFSIGVLSGLLLKEFFTFLRQKNSKIQ